MKRGRAQSGRRLGAAEMHRVRHVEPRCCECGGLGRLKSGAQVFPSRQELHGQAFYVCECGARVGCHRGTAIPLGRPAGWRTRQLRQEAHELLDAVWGKPAGRVGRKAVEARRKAYRRLAVALQIRPDDCHLGWFDGAMCERAIAVIKSWTLAREAAS